MASPGNLVEYFHNKKLLCALCLSVDSKDQLQVRTEENREDKVAKTKLVLVSNESMSPDSDNQTIVQWLRAAAARREQCCQEISLQDLWELTSEEGCAFSLSDLANIQFSKPVPEQLSGLYRALERDKLWFVRKGQDYQPRSAEQIQETRQRLQAEEERAREREYLTVWLKALWNGQPLPDDPTFGKSQSRYLNWIREVALHGSEASRFKEIQSLFKDLEIGGKDAAFRLMIKAGLWGPDEFLQLHRCHPPMDFSLDLAASAAELRERLHSELENPERLDLTALPAVTIDDPWTSEVDDGLTLERLEDGYRVGIHIADASTFLDPGTPLDEEALERGTTIYLPERKIRMVPDILGDELCSLIEGQDRLAFSFLVEFDQDFQVRSSRFADTKIRVTQRLNYQEADALLEARQPGDLLTLYEIALAQRSKRQAAGAVTLPFPRVNIRVETPEGEEPQISITRDQSEAPAQVLVSEMMILANGLSGAYFAEHSIPALFRSQPEPEKPIPADVDTAPENLHKLRRLMKKGEVGMTPARHSGLGIDAYSQSTSPIRRYVDLIAHRQLKSHLRTGEAFYTADQLEPMMQRLNGTTHQAEQLERERKQYWTLRYLESKRWSELDAVVLSNFPDKHWIQISSILYETDCPLIPKHPLSPGTKLKVRIEMVFPREQGLRVTPVLDED
ncbi:MAG: RNB domain-containing ribonuclease [Candidatus Eremiobacteraeota bacterium]|nr:RNB domain-containing ribonuclease [Candidatus Eremiobacteraeota bacterium]